MKTPRSLGTLWRSFFAFVLALLIVPLLADEQGGSASSYATPLTAVGEETPHSSFHRDLKLETLNRVANVSIPPNNAAYLANLTLPRDIWTRGVKGRVFPIIEALPIPEKNVTGIDFTAEYYIATTMFYSPPDGFRPLNYHIDSYIPKGRCAEFEYHVNYTNITGGADNPCPLSIAGKYYFRKALRHGEPVALIQYYDVKVVDQEDWSTCIGSNNSDPAVQAANIAFACTMEQTYCLGGLQQYPNYTACVDFMTTKIPYGTAYDLMQDSALCRFTHSQMLAAGEMGAEVHCIHVGPSGGGACVNFPFRSYVQFYNQQFGDIWQTCGTEQDFENEDPELEIESELR